MYSNKMMKLVALSLTLICFLFAPRLAPDAAASWMKEAFEQSKPAEPKARARPRRRTTPSRARRNRRAAQRRARQRAAQRRAAQRRAAQRRAAQRQAAAVVNQQQAANKATVAAAQEADGGLLECSELQNQQWQAINNCVADKLDALADRLESDPAANAVSPQVITTIRETATKVRRAPSRDAALVALQSARIVLQTALLAAHSEGKSPEGFGGKEGLAAVSLTLGKAVSAVQLEI